MKNTEIDMTTGRIWPKMLQFVIPLALSSLLQLLFNAADLIVIGNYAGAAALAAVGTTGALINLIINIFLGLSVGANVLVARQYGAGNHAGVSRAVHTAIFAAAAGGVLFGLIGILLCRPLLEMMNIKGEVLDKAALYMRIYFAGLPVIGLYNYGSAILRAVGDTKRPLIFLSVAGVLNVVMNLFFVIVLKMDVDGVALATVLSQCVSTALVLLTLMRTTSSYRLDLRRLRMDGYSFSELLRIGVPAGVQGMCFSLSNVIIQSTVNSFGEYATAGNAACSNIEGFVYVIMNAFHQACLAFTGQNMGARKYERIDRILSSAVLLQFLIAFTACMAVYLLRRPLLGIYIKAGEEEAIRYGMIRMQSYIRVYFLCGIMDIMSGMLRGMGYSLSPTLIVLVGTCLLRIVWVFFVFPAFRTLECLYLSYPISWSLTALIQIVFYLTRRKKAFARSERMWKAA